MTLQSNADNRAQAQAQAQAEAQANRPTPSPVTPGKPSIPGPAARPSLFKSASYISSSNLKAKKETTEQRNIRKAREMGEGIEKDKDKDLEKEKEREMRRMERRAARRAQAGVKDGSTSGSNETAQK
jgi:hypothetical protein